jgi:hypothetical protein
MDHFLTAVGARAEEARGPQAADGVHVSATFGALPDAQQASVSRMLDRASTANPYHDPAFCGPGYLDSGLRSFHFTTQDGQFYAFCTEHFAASRHLPFVRQLILESGPVADTPDAFESGLRRLRDWSRRQGYVRLSMHPRYPQMCSSWLDGVAARGGWRRIERKPPEGTLLFDLRWSEDELFARLKKRTRYEIRRAARSGIVARRIRTRAEASAFYEVYTRRAYAKGFDVIDRLPFLALAERTFSDPQRGVLFMSERARVNLCGIFALRAGRRVHYVFGAINEHLSGNLPAAYPAMWAAILWARSTGADEFDFGGYADDGDPGVRQFKRGFSGREVQYAPGFKCGLW